MTTRLIVARHGNTFAPGDVVTRLGGRTDLPLVASGVAQAGRLGLHLQRQGLVPHAVFTATLARTRQTAAEALRVMGLRLPLTSLPLFDEIDYGPDENRPEAEVVARLGADALKAWDDAGIVPPGWRADVAAIVQGWLDFGRRLAGDFRGKTVLVVTSNGIARFAPHLTGDFETFRRRHSLKLATGAYALLQAANDGTWAIQHWNVKPA